ncbi:hypothetical protein F4779DRAFT_329306 [Xylariaceae sp. FL0662B]|nr:hypothetical protein F4779DRAFT_329306 [Xylariaceae sp. FL0662B]
MKTSQPRPGSRPVGGELWEPDLPHHFIQPAAGMPSNIGALGFAADQGVQQPGIPLQGLNDLASAAAISHPYNYPQLPISNQRPPSSGPSAFLGNGALPARTPGATAQHREQQRARRRVPLSQRKRTRVSCDACKTRRCKCVRPRPGATSVNDPEREGTSLPCKSCADIGIPCVTTMARKHRVYGSVENLDKRYRALEALVQGFFPYLNPRASAEELVSFGRERGIEMPDFRETPHRSSPAQPTVKSDGAMTFQHATSQPQQEANSIVGGADSDKTVFAPAYTTRGASTMSAQLFPQKPEDHPEPGTGSTGLIMDASGRPHYIGPCGSLKFFANMRDLLANYSSGARVQGVDEYPDPPTEEGTGRAFSGVKGVEDQPPSKKGACPDSRGDDHLAGDSPPRISQELLEKYPEDPDYRRYRRPVSEVELPPREQGDACVGAFFHDVHPNFILFHRPTFQLAYETLWRSWEAHRDGNADEGMKQMSVSVGWLVCLYMIFVLGSRSLPQTRDLLEFQRKWIGKIDELPSLLSTSSLPNVCAYMLLSLYYHHTNDRTSAWMFHGAACRLAIALGMHRESVSSSFDTLQSNVRKRVWWTMYTYEQFLCCSLGRPSAIDDREVDVGIPDEGLLDGDILPRGYWEHASQLTMLLAAVRRGIFDPGINLANMYRRALEFLEPLAAWEEHIPKGLRPRAVESFNGNVNQYRSVLLLHVRYQHALSFSTRPFLLKVVESKAGEEPDATKMVALGQVCLTASMRSSALLIDMWRAGCLDGVSWFDIYYAYLASMVIILALFSPKSLVQDEGDSKVPRPQLIQKYTTAEMKDRVSELCRMMAAVDMCGTNAQFAKVSREFAIALGIISSERRPSIRRTSSVQGTMAVGESPNKENRNQTTEEDKTYVEHLKQGKQAGEDDQVTLEVPGYLCATNNVNQEFLNSSDTDMDINVQWDM